MLYEALKIIQSSSLILHRKEPGAEEGPDHLFFSLHPILLLLLLPSLFPNGQAKLSPFLDISGNLSKVGQDLRAFSSPGNLTLCFVTIEETRLQPHFSNSYTALNALSSLRKLLTAPTFKYSLKSQPIANFPRLTWPPAQQ